MAKQLNQETGAVLKQLRRHATVMREGFEVPLIGVPRDAVLEVCDSCGETIGLSQSTFTGTQMLCPKCMVEPPNTCDVAQTELAHLAGLPDVHRFK